VERYVRRYTCIYTHTWKDYRRRQIDRKREEGRRKMKREKERKKEREREPVDVQIGKLRDSRHARNIISVSIAPQ
jgi:hypothetical protein